MNFPSCVLREFWVNNIYPPQATFFSVFQVEVKVKVNTIDEGFLKVVLRFLVESIVIKRVFLEGLFGSI